MAKGKAKYKAGRKYEQGFLAHLAESVGMHHRGDIRKGIISGEGRARMARGMLKRWGERSYAPVDRHSIHRAVASHKWEGRK